MRDREGIIIHFLASDDGYDVVVISLAGDGQQFNFLTSWTSKEITGQFIDNTPTCKASYVYPIFTSLADCYQVWSNHWLAGYTVDGREGVG